MNRTTPLVALLALACAGEPDDSTPVDTQDDVCDGDVCTLTGTITEDLTMTADKSWLLRGGVFIGDDVAPTTLTIEPGTTIYGESATDGMLVIRRASRIVAQGTAVAPIVFTSSKAVGDRARGDWGGLIVNGRAPLNSCSDTEITLCEAFGEGGTGWYGGNDPTDDSGVLEYVRVEFAGTLISPDNELNGIALQGVGSGTTLDHLQVHQNADDGVEFFGGTADVKHLLVTGVGDDGLDWTDGWTGRAQFVIVQQYANSGDNGIEADNNAEANDATPRSAPTISHVTLIGSPDSSASDLGILVREGTAGHLSNVVVTGFNQACLSVDHAATFTQVGGGALTLDRSILHHCGPADPRTAFYATSDGEVADVEALFTGGTGNRLVDPELGDAFDALDPDYAPSATGPAATGGQAPGDAFFTAATYVGAVDPNDDWTVGWTTHAAN